MWDRPISNPAFVSPYNQIRKFWVLITFIYVPARETQSSGIIGLKQLLAYKDEIQKF